jgi:hypothetical protein
LCKYFEDENFTVSRSAVCALLMKRLEKIPARRNYIELIEQRKVKDG